MKLNTKFFAKVYCIIKNICYYIDIVILYPKDNEVLGQCPGIFIISGKDALLQQDVGIFVFIRGHSMEDDKVLITINS